MAVVVCKWSAQLVRAVLDIEPDTYVILDDFDVEHMEPDWELLSQAAHVYRVNEFDSIEGIAGVAADLSVRGVTVKRVISFTEFSQFGAGYLELLLGLGQDPLAHVAFRDKRLMKERVGRAGVPITRWASLPDRADLAGVAEIRDALAFPIVVKPAAGFGTMSTFTVGRPEELEPALTDFALDPHLKSGQLIAEEFVHGSELHVDGLWADGQPLFFVVSRYYRPRLELLEHGGELSANVPADGSVVILESEAADLYRRILLLHREVNGALGIETAVTHLELFEEQDGSLVFSEIATRLGGGWIPGLLDEVLGRPVLEVVAEGLLHGKIAAPAPTRAHLGALHLRPDRPGRITALPTEQEMSDVDGVLRAQRLRDTGDVVELSNPSEWCAFVVLGADTAAEYDELARRVVGTLRVEVEETS